MKKQIVEKPRYTEDEVLIINGIKVPTVIYTFPGSKAYRLVRVVDANLSAISCGSDFKGNKRRISIPLDAVYQDPENPSVEFIQYAGAFREQSLEPEVHHPHRNHHR